MPTATRCSSGRSGTRRAFRIQARTRSADGTLSAVQTLSKGGQSAYGPQVAVDADGDALVTWRADPHDGSNWRIQARALSAAGTLSRVENLSDPGELIRRAPGRGRCRRRRARHLVGHPGGEGAGALGLTGLGARRRPSIPIPEVFLARVAMNAAGDAVVTWQRKDRGGPRIQTRARSADGTLSPVQSLSNRWRYSGGAEPAIDAEGDAVFAWVSSTGPTTGSWPGRAPRTGP